MITILLFLAFIVWLIGILPIFDAVVKSACQVIVGVLILLCLLMLVFGIPKKTASIPSANARLHTLTLTAERSANA